MRKLYAATMVILSGFLILIGCHGLKVLKREKDDKEYLSRKYRERGIDYYEKKALSDAERERKMEADYKFNIQDYEEAARKYTNIATSSVERKGKSYLWAKLQLARLYFETRQLEKSRKLYEECLDIDVPGLTEKDVCNYLDLLKRVGEISQAYNIVKQYEGSIYYNTRFSNTKRSIEKYYTFLEDFKHTDVEAEQLNLGLKGYQYGLALYKKGVVFMSNYTDEHRARSYFVNSRMYYLDKTGMHSLNSSIKYKLQMGPLAFYNNYTRVIYTTHPFKKAVKTEKHEIGSLVVNNTQLVSAVYVPGDEDWRNNGRVSNWIGTRMSEKYSFMHPFVAEMEDQKRLLFSSNMPGGYGGMDLYSCTWNSQTRNWGKPVNLGPKINTNGDELYPVFYPKLGEKFVLSGGLLLFVSNGHEGYGGLDIYVTRMDDGASIDHLPYPYNTQFDDLNPVWDRHNDVFYLSSDRAGNHIKDKIYAISMKKYPLELLGYPPLVPVQIAPPEMRTAKDEVPPRADPFRVLFEFDSAGLYADQLSKIDAVYDAWKDYSDAYILVEGHTDNIGTEDYNYSLSRERAQNVCSYLNQKGVPVSRLILSYYGASKPLVKCPAEENDKLSCRRIEAVNRRCDIYIRLKK